MTTAIEYALMAGASYISTRPEINRFPVPDGWAEKVIKRQALPSGFEATYFTKGTGANTEIVISFAGTGSGLNTDWIANCAMATGGVSEQLRQAAQYYLDIKATNPGAAISFTGHSLGGGIASLLSVFFGEQAVTFDQAPFRNSATNLNIARDLKTYLTNNSAGIDPAKLADILAPLDRYISAMDPTNPNPVAADKLDARQAQVLNINVEGEMTHVFELTLPITRGIFHENITDSCHLIYFIRCPRRRRCDAGRSSQGSDDVAAETARCAAGRNHPVRPGRRDSRLQGHGAKNGR